MAKELTERQRYWLEHIRAAGERGQTLKDYAQERQLSVSAMYTVKSLLMKRGVLPGRECEDAVSELVPVRVAALASAGLCRLRHPSGWSLECECWPDPRWLRAVVDGGDASA